MLYRELGALVALTPQRGQRRAPFATQDSLVPLDHLKRVQGMLEIAWENQGNWSCRCPLGPGDPPVYSNALDVWHEPGEGFQKVCDSLNHFLVTLSLQEAVFSAPILLAIEPRPLETVFSAPIEPLWLAGWYVGGKPTHDFYAVPGQELLVMEYADLWVACHEERVLELVRPEYRADRAQ
jgi:hypothetical protein